MRAWEWESEEGKMSFEPSSDGGMLGRQLPQKLSLTGIWPWFRGSYGSRRPKAWELSWCQLGFWLRSHHGSACGRRHLW